MPKVHRNRWRGTLTDFDARQKAFQAAYHTAAVGDPTLDLIRFDLVSSHRLHVEDSRKRKRIDCDESVAVGSQSSLSSAADKQGDSEVGGIALNAVEPTPIAGKGFEHAVQAIKEARRVGLNSPLYWAALDLRDRGVSPCGDTRRAADLLEPRDIDPIVARFKNIMRQARDESSQSALALLDTLQALKRDLDPPSKLAETILEHGSKAFILSLKDQIRTKKRDAEEAQSQSLCGSPDSDDLQRSQELEKHLEQLEYLNRLPLDHKDPASVWILETILGVRRIAQVPKHPTERTNDIYYLADFAKLPFISLRYGEGQSTADRDDKKHRKPTTMCGKKVDFNFLLNSRELGTGENAGTAPSEDKCDSDFIATIKAAISQIRSGKREIFAGLDILNRSNDISELAAAMAPPFFTVDGMKICFYVLFEIGTDIFAFKDFGALTISNIQEDLSVLAKLARCFLLFQQLMINANAAIESAKLRVQQATAHQLATEDDEWLRGTSLCLTPIKKSSVRPKALRKATAPLPGTTPIKRRP